MTLLGNHGSADRGDECCGAEKREPPKPRPPQNHDYSGGERWPHLERIDGKPDVLSDIMRPRATK